MKTKKIFFLFLLTTFLILPEYKIFAQELATEPEMITQEESFTAQVIEILDQKEIQLDGQTSVQQNLKLRGLSGTWAEKIIEIQGITDIIVSNQLVYEIGDKVLVNHTTNTDTTNSQKFHIVDRTRTGSLLWLSILFVLLVVIIGQKKGIRSIIVLALSMILILYFLIPQILAGGQPVFWSILCGVLIMFLSIFFTEGINTKSKLAFKTILISFVILTILSFLFTKFADLSGLWDENASFILNIAQGKIDLQGLLLAGIIIGTLGVLDDVIISQISTVQEIAESKKDITKKELFSKSMNVGTDHINAMINTLFLAYTGASLPLLILFSVHIPPFETFYNVVNNELIATEIIRTLVGSITLILSVPIATWFATKKFGK